MATNTTRAMSQMVDNSSVALLISEILDKVHKAKTKADKLKILRLTNILTLKRYMSMPIIRYLK